MNYILAMGHLNEYRETKSALGKSVGNAGNIVKNFRASKDAAARIDRNNIVSEANRLTMTYKTGDIPRLTQTVKSNIECLEAEYTMEIHNSTSAFERQMSEIGRKAQDTINKGVKKPLSQCPGKMMLSIMLAIFGIAMFGASFALKSMKYIGGNYSQTCMIAGAACFLLLLCVVSIRPSVDEGKLASLVNEARNAANQYYGFICPILENAYAKLEANYSANISEKEKAIKEEIGERVFILFENTPYFQQEYFIRLGMTATCEDDFNSIAQECLKADKAQQQINLQNMINIETRNSINKGIAELNKTASRIHEDAEFRARQQAAQNEELLRQNERQLKNQSKALDQIKKSRNEANDFERWARNNSDK